MPDVRPEEPSMSSRLLDMFTDQHRERMDEAVELRKAVNNRLTKIEEDLAQKPGKPEVRAVFGFLALLILLLVVGIYQLKGIDSSKAVRDVNVITNGGSLGAADAPLSPDYVTADPLTDHPEP